MAEPSFNLHGTGGDVIGAGVGGSGHIIGKQVTVTGNIIQLVNPSPEAIAELTKINAMATAVPPGSPGGLKGSAAVGDSANLQGRIDELLALLKQSGAAGQPARTINAGGVNVSRVDLLLKKAILLKSEADQMYFTQVEKLKPRPGAGGGPAADREALLKDFDTGKHMSRLRDSYAHLQEANELDPTHTEVLLAMAQLLVELTPDDPSDERRLLYRIQKLLGTPRDDDERFRLAQATFLMATTCEPIERDSLQDARRMFEKLGRGEWVRQCDALLDAESGQFSPPPAAPGAVPPKLPRAAGHPTPGFSPPAPPAAFQPVGRWQFQITDAVGSVMIVDLFPNGLFNAMQNAGPYAAGIEAQGQWLFNPYNQMLQLQGMIAGYMPFMLGVVIQRPHLNGFHGVGTDNCAYFITRLG
jgi:hypothetical protein